VCAHTRTYVALNFVRCTCVCVCVCVCVLVYLRACASYIEGIRGRAQSGRRRCVSELWPRCDLVLLCYEEV
jgi:hypothetical protein